MLGAHHFVPVRLQCGDQLLEARAIGPKSVGEYDARFALICHGATPDLIWLCTQPPANAETLWSKVGSNKADAGNTSRNSVMSALGQKADIRVAKVMSSLFSPPKAACHAVARVPAGVDAAEAATRILSWTTAYQLLHRAARVRRGQRVLVHGAAGAVGQALLVLGGLAGLELWGT